MRVRAEGWGRVGEAAGAGAGERTVRTKLYPVIRRVNACGGGGTEKIPGRANKLNTASEMTAAILFIPARPRARARAGDRFLWC